MPGPLHCNISIDFPNVHFYHTGHMRAAGFGISKKLFIFFSVFILIFSGTVFDLFVKVREISGDSARIVSVNNRISALSKTLSDRLVDMDVSDKKYRLLKKELYFEGFETARQAYCKSLDQILALAETDMTRPWWQIHDAYRAHTRFRPMEDVLSRDTPWMERPLLTRWMDAIAGARNENERQIEQALIRINDRTRQVARNGMIGFGLSIIAGLAGILFITRSVLSPLKKLKAGIKQVSEDSYSHQLPVAARDEFGELTSAFNDMTRQLKADEEIRSDFIASLSHEIRTPLSSIRESVNMIREGLLGPVNPKQNKFLTLAGDEIVRITTLLTHLLDSSMAGDDLPRPPSASMDPNEVVRTATAALSPAAALRRVALSFSPLTDAPRVIGEEREIIQVLTNILGNALKFSPDNSRIDLWLEKETPPRSLTFYISDAGPGIPPEKHGLIFKKYYRAEDARNHMDGVGLGLNISKRIIRAHGGRIGVRNNPDRGCTFFFTLPLERKRTLPHE